MFDYSKLRGKIVEQYGTIAIFAHEIPLNRSTLSAKLNNAANFTQEEMARIIELLGDDVSNISTLFFTDAVGEVEQNSDDD